MLFSAARRSDDSDNHDCEYSQPDEKRHSGIHAQYRSAGRALHFAFCSVADAQQPVKVPRIAYLSGSSFSNLTSRIDAFRQGLREVGYVEGKNIVIEWREAKKLDRVREVADELVGLKMDVIVSPGPAVTRPLKQATSTIPIVMAQDTDPVGSGFVTSLAHPGGNITGLAALAPEMGGKQLELLKEIIPKLSRVAVVGNSTVPGDAQALRETVLAAGSYEIYLATWIFAVPTRLMPFSKPPPRAVRMQSLSSATPP